MPKQKRTKTPKQPRNFSLRSTVRRRIHKIRKLITRRRVYIAVAGIALVLVASTAAYAMNSTSDLKNRNPKPSTTSDNSSSEGSQAKTNFAAETPVDTSAIKNYGDEDCYQIDVVAEALYLKTTDSLVFPHFGDPRSAFDAYNSAYRLAYNTYVNTVKSHGCNVNITDKGDVQYFGPTCNSVASNNIVDVLRAQIYSAVNLDNAKYNLWLTQGHNMTYSYNDPRSVAERNYIQNDNNYWVRVYVSEANKNLNKINCPSLDPTAFYTQMF